jgi:GGDEF domain-containing protein
MAASTQKDTQKRDAQNNLAYAWDLNKDHIDWVGPVHRFMVEADTTNGSSFLEQLSTEDFWKYLSTLETAIHDKRMVHLEHSLKNTAGDVLKVTHEASFKTDSDGHLSSLQGTLWLQSSEAEPDAHTLNDEINPITFLPNVHLLVENLKAHMAESSSLPQKGSLIVLSFNRLILLNAVYGTEQVRQLFFNMAKAIRQQIRFDDYFAHIHACVFALILRDCDESTITAFCRRIEEVLKDVSLTLTGDDLTITARITGLEIDSTINAGEMIKRALMNLNSLPMGEMPSKSPPTPPLNATLDRRKTDY